MGLKRFTFLTDIHGDMADTAAVNAALSFVRDFKPHYRVCGGDVFDFRALRGKASEEEKRESLRGDFEAGDRFLDSYRPTHVCLGNHDFRAYERAEVGNGPVSDYCAELVGRIESRLSAASVLPHDRGAGVLRLGQLAFLHGFYVGESAAKKHAATYGSCVYGHCHTTDAARAPGIDRRVAYGVGCLCSLNLPYDKKSPGALRHSQGFAYGTLDEKTGAFAVFQAERVDGKFYVATEVRAVA